MRESLRAVKSQQPKVSIVITTYNCADTIGRCLDAALMQTLDNIEIIVVDDASIDETAAVLKEYQGKSPNIRCVFNKENGGAGYAKNRGVEVATGVYVGFLDSDDYVGENYYELLYRAATKRNADVACANIMQVDKKSLQLTSVYDGNLFTGVNKNGKYFNRTEIISAMVLAGFWGGSSACTKIIRRELLQQFPFYEGRRCDDLPAILPALVKARNIAYVPLAHYHYVQTENSVERKCQKATQLDALRAIGETFNRYRQIDAPLCFSQMIAASSLMSVLGQLFDSSKDSDSELHFEILHCLGVTKWIDEFCNLINEKDNPYLAYRIQYLSPISDRIHRAAIVWGQCSEVKRKKQEGVYTRELQGCPEVSVIIPVYNGSNYMVQAIDSALAQTYTSIEVIVVNDGSRDQGATDIIARAYGDSIRYIRKKNGGVATALNCGIEKMRGTYFSWLSHDDMYAPEKIAHQMQLLSKMGDKETILVGGYWVTDASGKPVYTVNLRDTYAPKAMKDPLFPVLRGGVNGCAVLIHKSHFDRVGNFDPTLPTTQDYDLWFRMFRGQKVYYAQTYDVLSRSHENQGSKALLSSHVKECDKLWIGMMEQLSDEEKVQISGSLISFYQGIYDFLKQATGYTGAIAYARTHTFTAAVETYERTGEENCVRTMAELSGVTEAYMLNYLLPRREKAAGKKRIMFQLGSRNDGGGLNRIVVQTANQLSEMYDAMICGWEEYDLDAYLSRPTVTEVFLQHPQDLEKYLLLLLLLLQVDVYIYSYCCAAQWMPLLEILHDNGIKTVAWSHEDYFLPFYYPHLWGSLPAREEYLPKADAVLWLNKSSLEMYATRHDNGVWMPNPVPKVNREKATCHHKKYLLAMGRYDDPRKGFDDLLYAFALILKEYPDAELYVVGSYDLDMQVKGEENLTCGKLIDKLSISADSLHLVGWTDKPEEYYKMATLHLMPSSYEGFGLVVLEAASFGVPTVAYDGSGMADIILNGTDGVLIHRGNYKEMAQRVCRLLDRPNQIKQLRDALPSMLHRFQPETILARWRDLIEALTSENTDAITLYFGRMNCRTFSQNNAELAIKEYESAIIAMQKANVSINTAEHNGGDAIWANECLLMQKSLSWRITKPLRLVKKVMVTWKCEGFGGIIRKVRAKLQQHHLNRAYQ